MIALASTANPSAAPARTHFNITIETGQEELWFAIRDLPGYAKGFTAEDLARAADTTESVAEFYLLRLVRQGHAQKLGQSDARKIIFAVPKLQVEPVVLDDQGRPSKDYAIRRLLWTAMRQLRQFTVTEVWNMAREHHAITRAQAKAFVEHLHEAGYLAELFGDGRDGTEFTLKRNMNTGRVPPKLCESTLVYDVNRRAFYGTALAREVRL